MITQNWPQFGSKGDIQQKSYAFSDVENLKYGVNQFSGNEIKGNIAHALQKSSNHQFSQKASTPQDRPVLGLLF